MTHISESYASKLAIAGALAALDARAVTITAVSKVRAGDARKKYAQIKGQQSHPGQTPKDHQWFLASLQRRQHAAFLLLTYHQYRMGFEPNPDAHGLAFTVTYRKYMLANSKDPLVSPERFNLLVGAGFGIGWRSIFKGGSSKFEADNVKVLNCRKCHVPHLVEAHFRSYVCPTHEH